MMKIDKINQKSRESGVSLVELSMVLTIIAILLASVLIAGGNQVEVAKETQTQAKLDMIEKALVAYVAVNGRLPCPANAALTYDAPGASDEDCTGTVSKTVSPVPGGYLSTTVSGVELVVIAGSVPVGILQLPNEFMLDGWGNKITYVMTKVFGEATVMASNSGSTNFHIINTNMGLIKVKDATLADRTDQAVLALISHGANGYGAWSAGNSGQNPASTDAAESENSHVGGIWDEVFVQKTFTRTFDDIVRYKMKWHLVRDAGAIIADPVCDIAKIVISTTPNSYCNATINPSMDPDCATYLGALANKVKELCLQ